MQFFAFIALTTSWSAIFLGSYAFSKKPNQLENQLFLLLCLFSAYWAIVEFLLQQSIDFKTASSIFPPVLNR